MMEHMMKLDKIKQYLAIISVLIMGLIVSSCSREPEKPALEFNSIVKNEDFINNLSLFDIKIVAPASGTAAERIEKLKELSFLDIPNDIIDDSAVYHSKSDENRFNFLQSSLNSKNTNSKNTVLWALRGGYGSARLINDMMKIQKPLQPVMVIGYSDITALHLFLSQKWKWKSIHGAMVNELLSPKKDPKNFEIISDLLSGKTKIAKLDNLEAINDLAKCSNKLSGLLTGGNLTVVGTSIGTNWQIQTNNKIVFLEDVEEDGYKVDRGLNHLKQAGLFKNVKAIILGDFSPPKDGKIEEVNFAIERFAKEINVPVYKTNQFGHGTINYPLIYNAQSEILRNGEHSELLMYMDR